MATRQRQECSSRASSSRLAGRTRRIGILMRCGPLWCYPATLYFGRGDKWDESKFSAYPAGTFYSEPAKAPHFTWAKDGEVIIQITGVGPSGKQPLQFGLLLGDPPV